LNTRWLILADDLTGAADAAVAFACRGHAAEVSWDAGAGEENLAVQAIDLDTRTAPGRDAAARHREAVQRRLGPGLSLFKKIDSTLRGQPAAEMAAIATVLRELGRTSWGVLAPANPPMRRTTRDGHVFIDGQPLEHTDTWKLEHSYPDADLAAMARSAGLHPLVLPLAAIRGDGQAMQRALLAAAESGRDSATLLVCDSETEDDLARVVAAARGRAEPGFFAGTAGLANALAASIPSVPKDPTRLSLTERGTLVAVGTLARVSRESARRLAAREGAALVLVDPEGESRGISMNIAATLARGETAIALLDAPECARGTVDPGYAEDFSATLALALRQMGALIVTGGETAGALLARCKVRGIRLLDEIEPGIALGMTLGEIEVPVITKPGAFGDEESLARCLDKLHQLRRNA
jgi:uncharacterized protein YgbK (DUF1537 family)